MGGEMMTLTERALNEIAPALSVASLKSYVPILNQVCERYEINANPRRLAMFLAQAAHESGGFSRLVENLNYSADGLQRTWPKRFPTIEFAQRYARQPDKIANYVYASRMGNGAEASGDGKRYRGRGIFQLTGKDNYAAAGLALSLPLVDEPQLAAEIEPACRIAGWFWHTHHLTPLADFEDVRSVTRAINGGVTGLAERVARYKRALAALEPAAGDSN